MSYIRDFHTQNKNIRRNVSIGNKYYGLIKAVVVLLIISGFIGLVSAYEETDLQWASGISKTLHRNDIIAYNGYTVKAISYPDPVESDRYSEIPSEPIDPFVGLNVSKNGSFANNTALGLENSYITPDGELRVIVRKLPSKNSTDWLLESYNPWATVELNPRGKPKLVVSVETDKDEYSSADDTEIIASVTVKNSGSADAVNVDLNIDAPFPTKNGGLKYHYERIKKGESVTEDIIFISPIPTGDQMYSILANASAFDVKDLPYPANSSKQLSVVVNPEWSMSLRKTTLEKIYLKDSAMVSITLKNNGKIDIKNVTIEDSVPRGFKLVSNTSLNWVADISAGGEWNYRYLVTPEEPNARGVVFPVATAEFKVKKELFGIRSNQPKIIVHGPLVTLEKHTDVSALNPGDTVTVTVSAKNNGSTPTRIFIKDQLPNGTTLVGGTTSFEEFLEAGKDVMFSYTIKIDSTEPVKLQPATAQYYKLGNTGGKISIESKGVEIRIKSPDEDNRVAEATQNITPPPPPETPAPSEPLDTEPVTSGNNGINEPGQDKLPVIEPPMQVGAILGFMLGCNDTSADNKTTQAYNACSYFKLNTP
ncbi:COG1361 family protein [Candidatus Methanoperedens nitratireducens]|uniref:DUF11 domain-containing protein n=1 Tax=Candidatus Methanoperedens nitratireducens TaxID=1392998 RepID=A0A284VQ07_9EURY|nr:DUF11 domain-containing protein [Candidatus Methanoperedens nitroreducens]SNQ61366.1 hypothetical protein MNV_330034 [Candidatus Methanoperedens nitroreducens]